MPEREKRLPVTARTIEQYRQAFGELFSESYHGRGLIIGPGFSNAALHPSFFGIDLGFGNVHRMLAEYRASSLNQASLCLAFPMVKYLAKLSNQFRRRSKGEQLPEIEHRLIAAQ